MIYCYCVCVFHNDENNTCMLDTITISDLTKKGYVPVCEEYIKKGKATWLKKCNGMNEEFINTL